MSEAVSRSSFNKIHRFFFFEKIRQGPNFHIKKPKYRNCYYCDRYMRNFEIWLILPILAILALFGQKTAKISLPTPNVASHKVPLKVPKTCKFCCPCGRYGPESGFFGWGPFFDQIPRKKRGAHFSWQKRHFLSPKLFFTPIYIGLGSWEAGIFGSKSDTWIYPPSFFSRKLRVIEIFFQNLKI